MNSFTRDFRVAPAKLYKNFVSRKNSVWTSAHNLSLSVAWEPPNEKLETKMGTTILHHMFRDATALTSLSLEFCAYDGILKLIAEHAPNLR